jgi:hypothetical protein
MKRIKKPFQASRAEERRSPLLSVVVIHRKNPEQTRKQRVTNRPPQGKGKGKRTGLEGLRRGRLGRGRKLRKAKDRLICQFVS